MRAFFIPKIVLLTSICHAFVPDTQYRSPLYDVSRCFLVPEQGCQLAAHTAAMLAKKESEARLSLPSSSILSDKTLEEDIIETATTPTNAARELAKRIFNLPSELLRTSVDSNSKDFPFTVIADHQDDEVVYPVVGFTFVKLDDNSMKAVPSPNTKASCDIDTLKASRTLPVYGWFSPACRLGEVYTDDEKYCGGPIKS